MECARIGPWLLGYCAGSSIWSIKLLIDMREGGSIIYWSSAAEDGSVKEAKRREERRKSREQVSGSAQTQATYSLPWSLLCLSFNKIGILL